MEYILSIANMTIKFEGDFTLPFNFEPFLIEKCENIACTCLVHEGDAYSSLEKPIYEGFLRNVYREKDGYVHVFFTPAGEQIGYARMSAQFDKMELVANREENVSSEYILRYFPIGAVLTKENGIYFHAACISHEGKAILFIAPSGTGKSTQADIWCANKGAEMINGDRAAVRLENGRAIAYGSPWAGSSGIFKNEGREVKAMVLLGQAKENIICTLTAENGLFDLMEQTEFPLWDSFLANEAMESFQEILSKVPAFYLKCVPDVSAADVLEKELN